MIKFFCCILDNDSKNNKTFFKGEITIVLKNFPFIVRLVDISWNSSTFVKSTFRGHSLKFQTVKINNFSTTLERKL